jgi:hypothetical protein
MPIELLDLRQDALYDMTINKDRTLKMNITAQTLSGGTYTDFDFSSYTGASLQVRLKPDSPYVVLNFNTNNGSIVLPISGGTFQLNKTAQQLEKIRAGEYLYDMYLISPTYPKRAFLSGSFIIVSNISI